jgi:methyl-accepting chemotaxis protein
MNQKAPHFGAIARMGVRSQIIALVTGALVAVAAVASVAYLDAKLAFGTAQQAFVAKDVTADILPPPLYLIELRLVLSQAAEGSLTPAKAQDEFGRLQKEYLARVTHWQENPPHGLERELLGAQHQAGLDFLKSAAGVLDAVSRGADPQGIKTALEGAHEVYSRHREGVDATVKSSLAFADHAMAEAADVKATTPWKIGGGLLVAGLLLAGLGLTVLRAIWSNLGGEPRDAAAVAMAVVSGNLSTPIAMLPGDQHSLMAQMKTMQDSLAGLVSRVRCNAESVATASQQIAQGSTDLSARTEQQASALKQTAVAMEQLGATVSQNADNSLEANQLARTACERAVKGGSVVADVVGTMRAINESSGRISDIIAVIDGIAFQTNILALNAAVEAARAGEQGRGFAVVASEVRSLAQRSSTAAKEIKSLITASVEQAERGAGLADQAGNTMQEVVEAIRKVTDIMGEISTASSEQRLGVAQANGAVNDMDAATERNASLAEESATAAQSLADQARALVGTVAAFRVDNDPRARAEPALS